MTFWDKNNRKQSLGIFIWFLIAQCQPINLVPYHRGHRKTVIILIGIFVWKTKPEYLMINSVSILVKEDYHLYYSRVLLFFKQLITEAWSQYAITMLRQESDRVKVALTHQQANHSDIIMIITSLMIVCVFYKLSIYQPIWLWLSFFIHHHRSHATTKDDPIISYRKITLENQNLKNRKNNSEEYEKPEMWIGWKIEIQSIPGYHATHPCWGHLSNRLNSKVVLYTDSMDKQLFSL